MAKLSLPRTARRNAPDRPNNVTPIRAGARESAEFRESAQFDDIYDRMMDELSALRCTLSTIESVEASAKDEELAAALHLFRRTYGALDALHSDLERWHIATRREQS